MFDPENDPDRLIDTVNKLYKNLSFNQSPNRPHEVGAKLAYRGVPICDAIAFNHMMLIFAVSVHHPSWEPDDDVFKAVIEDSELHAQLHHIFYLGYLYGKGAKGFTNLE